MLAIFYFFASELLRVRHSDVGMLGDSILMS